MLLPLGEALIAAYDFFDVVFLDIDMQGLMGLRQAGGFGRKIMRRRLSIYTSYRDYVAGAFEVHAFQYLLKPVSPAQLTQILEEIFRYLKEPDNRMILDFHTMRDWCVWMPQRSVTLNLLTGRFGW